MSDSPTFWLVCLIVLALLSAYLCFSIEKRRRAEEAKWLAQENERRAKWQAQLAEMFGADSVVAAIAPTIQRLRQNHLAALQTRPHEAYYRRGLIAAVRQMVTNLPYFHRVRPEHEVPKPDAAHS